MLAQNLWVILRRRSLLKINFLMLRYYRGRVMCINLFYFIFIFSSYLPSHDTVKIRSIFI